VRRPLVSAFVRRHASPAIVARAAAAGAGLAFDGELDWRPLGDRRWRVTLPLPSFAAGTLLIPSLSLGALVDAQFQFDLDDGSSRWPLPPIPGEAPPPVATDGRIRCAVDCWEIVTAVADLRLEVELRGLDEIPPYWLSVSARPVELTEVPLPAPGRRVALQPPARSQRLAAPALAPRVCSPTSVTMLLDGFAVSGAGSDALWQSVIEDCFDPGTNLYGVWPRALRAAARRGVTGAVEAFSDWHTVTTLLDAGLPVVLSVRFDADALPGSPQRASGGHLLVLYGIEDDAALVMDPAAESLDSVARRYPLRALADAWLRHRGAAYMLLP